MLAKLSVALAKRKQTIYSKISHLLKHGLHAPIGNCKVYVTVFVKFFNTEMNLDGIHSESL